MMRAWRTSISKSLFAADALSGDHHVVDEDVVWRARGNPHQSEQQDSPALRTVCRRRIDDQLIVDAELDAAGGSGGHLDAVPDARHVRERRVVVARGAAVDVFAQR